MNIWKSLLILGITIGLSTLILGSIFTYFRYFRTRREIPGGQNYERGSQRLQQRDYKGAIEAFTQALRLNPNLIEAYTSRGNARLLLGDKPGALEDYNHPLHLNPNCANAYYQRGNAYSDLGNKHEAIKDYQIAAKLFFEQKDTANYQLTLNELKKLQQQRTGSTSAVNNQDNPQPSQTQHTDTIYTNQNAEDFLNQGLNKARQGDYREAIADFDRAIQISPNSAHVYHNRGIAYSKVGDKQRAIHDYETAVKLFYEQRDDVNGKHAWENLQNLQQPSTHTQSVGNATKPFQRSSTSTDFSTSSSSKSHENQLSLDRASRQLQHQLLRLLEGDRNLAMRLLSQVKMKNPGKSIDWYVEKVIYDLERDRSR